MWIDRREARKASFTVAWRTAFCAAFSWLAWHLGPVAFCSSLGLFGLLLSRPLMDLAGEVRGRANEHVWRDVEGRYYTYRGSPVQVLEDLDRVRWMRLADVERLLGRRHGEAALRLERAWAVRPMGDPPEAHVRVDALQAHLAPEGAEACGRFALWLEREVALPARMARKRWGIREPEDGDPSA